MVVAWHEMNRDINKCIVYNVNKCIIESSYFFHSLEQIQQQHQEK